MTSSWLTVRLLGHDPGAAELLAVMSGLLALVITILASPEVQETARTWIRHRAEGRIAAAEAFDRRRRSRARTYGRRWSRGSAEQIRQAAAAPDQSRASLAEIMRITRNREQTAPGATPSEAQPEPATRPAQVPRSRAKAEEGDVPTDSPVCRPTANRPHSDEASASSVR
jgi:hypothetical protein